MKTVRAEHVGSLLRPRAVIDARARHDAGELPLAELRALEDRAVLDALELQRKAGMPVLTDGEMRRETWLALWWETLDGLAELPEQTMRLEWSDVDESLSQDDLQLEPVVVAEKLRRRSPSLPEVEAAFLAEHAHAPFKITMASATMATTLWAPGLSDAAYATPDELLRDAVAVQIEEIEALLDAGVTWIQLDSLRYNGLIDDAMRAVTIEAMGLDPQQVLAQIVDADNEVIEAARRKNPDVTIGVHFCRGNNRSAWIASGGYEAIAEKMLGGVDADRFLLEYDTDRAGGFEPLRFVPKGKTVVLGLVSSKLPQLESKDELKRRIEEASKHVAIEDLALSPQCGFASTLEGNLLTVDDELRKLELVVETAAEVWQ